jgi:dipeptidyl aminopeptidase/acylaminoacyl peptidase
MILFEQADGIYRVPASGGTPLRIIEAQEGERLAQAQLLPGGRGVLYTAATGNDWDSARITVQSVDPLGEPVAVWIGADARYVETGHLTYVLEDSLFAVPFDLDALEVVGGAVSLEQGLQRGAQRQTANYGLSDNGSLVYRRGAGGGLDGALTLVWVDRQGAEEVVGLDPAPYYWPRLSPDGTRLLVSMLAENEEVWLSDLTRSPPTRTTVTTDPNLDNVPIWTRDGERVLFASEREGRLGFFSKRADGTGTAEALIAPETNDFLIPFSWSPDGATLAFAYTADGKGPDIGIVSMEGEASWEPLIATEAEELHPAISPDGNWIAYDSDFTGTPEVYVERFPDLGGRVTISTSGGEKPVWSADGSELFYVLGGVGAGLPLVAVSVETEPTFRVLGEAEVVLEGGTWAQGNRLVVNYDYDSVNQRFLVTRAGPFAGNAATPRPQIITVLNWTEELKERVPVP